MFFIKSLQYKHIIMATAKKTSGKSTAENQTANTENKKAKLTNKGNDKDTGKGRGFGKSDDKSPIR